MNNHTTSETHTTDHSQSVTDASLAHDYTQPDLISDDDIDYEEIIATTQPDFEAGRFAFDSRNYATHEEAMAAMETLLLKCFEEAPDDKEG
jgi:hypothetical protein